MTIYKNIYLRCLFLYIYLKQQIKKLYNRYFINDNDKF